MNSTHHHAHALKQEPAIVIVLTPEASARMLGIDPALYRAKETLARLSSQIDDALAEARHWESLAEAEEDEAAWRTYERREELALERYATLLGLWTDLVEKVENDGGSSEAACSR